MEHFISKATYRVENEYDSGFILLKTTGNQMPAPFALLKMIL
jgi:hypothetical protein